MKVSILTSCYNKRAFLPMLVASIIGQDYSDFEFIFVDDCSDDGSFEYISSVNNAKLRVFRNEQRMYCSSSYDLALSHAKGDIIGVVDADDALVAGAIHRIVNVYNKYNSIGHIYTQHWWCDEQMSKRKKGLSSLPLRGHSFIDMGLKHHKHCYSHWRTARTHIARAANIFGSDLKCSVDKQMGYALQFAASGGFLDEPLYYYRYYKANMSRQDAGLQKKEWGRLLKSYKQIQKVRPAFPVVKVS